MHVMHMLARYFKYSRRCLSCCYIWQHVWVIYIFVCFSNYSTLTFEGLATDMSPSHVARALQASKHPKIANINWQHICMNPPASSAGPGSIFTPAVAAAGFLHARQRAASQGDLAGRQLQGLGSLAEDERQLESRGSSEQHERSPLLARAKSLTSALSMML